MDWMVRPPVWGQSPPRVIAHARIAFRYLKPEAKAEAAQEVGGYSTSVSYMLTMAFDDPSMDADLREALAAHEIVLGKEWAVVD